MKNCLALCLIALPLLFAGTVPARPAAPGAEAKKRAVLYQAETRGALIRSGWRVAVDQPGRLVATHPAGLQGANFGNSLPNNPALAYLTIKFEARTVDYTDCAASIVGYVGMQDIYEHQFRWTNAMPFDTPESRKRIQGIMADAEGRLVKNHPEYAGR